MEIRLNGEPKAFADAKTVSELLADLDIPAPGTAVAINGKIVARDIFDSRQIANGDRVDILRAIGGG